MKKYSSELKAGMKLLKPVYYENSILINEDVILDRNAIEKIKKFNILEVDIVDENGLKIEEELEKENMLKEVFELEYENSIEKAKEILENAVSSGIEAEEIENIIGESIKNLELDSDVLIRILQGESAADYLFQHSLNTVIISLLIGDSLGYSKEKLELLGKGALLHDVGMLKIKKETLEKSEDLSSDEIMEIKKHTAYGEEIIGDKIEKDVLDIIKYHHEKMDGTGYPEGLKGNEIPEMAKVVNIADIYCALIENRNYRERYDYYDAMKIVMKSSISLVDDKILKSFLKRMPIYPINTKVILNDGRKGVVSKASSNPFRPIIDIVTKGVAERINLTEEGNLTKYIVGVDK
ncbi:HD-GYP domain-containing protein [Haliovirga abyssi]|uniref:Phosphohydrolase n=1 Tax=Haliovirga abyssi TaxID=2996794 RepID=A0AAU9DHE9_9FUSO|nr:HD domain-containing phosphohydrolase [Haliovirga abyssi]BDU50159.1 phosphohydrolase [Haliovirga abyssi]